MMFMVSEEIMEKLESVFRPGENPSKRVRRLQLLKRPRTTTQRYLANGNPISSSNLSNTIKKLGV